MRFIPPVHSPVSPRSLIAAVPAMLGDGAAQERELEELFRSRYEARHVALMDSGTSALVEAFRMLAAVGRERVACPAYICVDVGAAAKAAGTSLALYDTDPATLSPDINSVAAALKSGAQAVLVAHLYGFPVDMRTVRELCSSHGAVLLEDAAQSAGGGYAGRPLGSFGDISVLSFGRGKGVTGGAGGRSC